LGTTESDLRAPGAAEAIRRAQALVARYVDPEVSLSESLIRDRREECETETTDSVESA